MKLTIRGNLILESNPMRYSTIISKMLQGVFISSNNPPK